HQNPGQHLDGGGLARAIRSNVAYHLPWVDSEANVVHGANGQVFAHEEVLDCALHAFAAAEGTELLREVLDFNNGWHDLGGVLRPSAKCRLATSRYPSF